jgi:rod shape-determining protein MreC
MLKDRAIRRHIVTYALLVAVSLLLLAFNATPQIQGFRQGVNFALAPIQEVLAGGARSVGSLFSAFAEIDQLRRENRAFEARTAQLEQQIKQLETLRTENDRLAKLLRTKGILDFRTAPAFVVTRLSQFERVITLDAGTETGMALGDPVLSDGGALVGVISDAGPGYATVTLLSDTRSLVIGRDVTTRATGEVRGNLASPLRMENVPATDLLKVGDTVVTAGLRLGGGIRSSFPGGLLIGTIVEVIDDPADIVSTATILPAADLEHLEAVLVITSFVPPVEHDPHATPDPDATAKPTPKPTPKSTPKR